MNTVWQMGNAYGIILGDQNKKIRRSVCSAGSTDVCRGSLATEVILLPLAFIPAPAHLPQGHLLPKLQPLS